MVLWLAAVHEMYSILCIDEIDSIVFTVAVITSTHYHYLSLIAGNLETAREMCSFGHGEGEGEGEGGPRIMSLETKRWAGGRVVLCILS